MNIEKFKKAYGEFQAASNLYRKMYEYYKGNTDAIQSYKFITERSNLQINANYIKKFVKEEVSYTVGNPITYESRTNDLNVINDIEYYTAHWNELHDSDLMKYLLIFTNVYELYYIDKNADFCSKIVKPIEGYAYEDIDGNIEFFIHVFKDKFNNVEKIDVYTKDEIYHFDSKFERLSAPTINIFKEVPVVKGVLTLEDWEDSLYKDIKSLQDAFETNLSDIGNEISDFRNAYLLLKNAQIDEDDLPNMKKLGILQFPNSDSGDATWLIKNINDTFIQNSLDRYVDTMYQLACHINHNEKLQSNLSGITLRSRLIALENKCELEQKAHKNIVKIRLKFLFMYLAIKKNKNYDYKDVKALYTPNIPSDDLATAQMLAQVPEGTVSRDTARGLFSFVNNKVAEAEKVKKELLDEIDIGNGYNDLSGGAD